MTRGKEPKPRGHRELARRFEDLITSLSSALITTADSDLGQALESVLGQIGSHFDVDRVTLWDYHDLETGAEFRVLSRWAVPGVSPLPSILASDSFPWATAQLLSGGMAMCSDLDELPEEAETDRASLEKIGARAHLSLPLTVGDQTVGALSLGVLRGRRDWSNIPVDRLQTVADTLSAALDRQMMHKKLWLSAARYKSFVQQASDGTWCMEFGEPLPLDLTEGEAVERVYEQARMVEVNDAFARMYGFADARQMGTWRLKEFLPRDSTTMDTLRAAISAGYSVSDLESHEISVDGIERIFLNNLSGEIVDGKLLRIWGTQRDVTEQREMESTLRNQRDQLAHLSRSAAIGEVTGALAHEINQPLTAIGSNAQAAKRLLKQESPDCGELAEIIDDVIADNRRAAEVIRRSRSLLKQKPAVPRPLDLGDLVSDALRLVGSDARLRDVTVELEPVPDLPPVHADPIQIQQVVLNLGQNACEAMSAEPHRLLRVRVSCADAGTATVSVCDSGPGLGDQTIAEIFEPYNSTKSDGLGMGLPISRSIIEAHDGRLWATENDDRGLTFHFSLPFAEPREAG